MTPEKEPPVLVAFEGDEAGNVVALEGDEAGNTLKLDVVEEAEIDGE
ncbi:hypothetical protein NOI24_08390 [Neorhizobium galegae]|nr:hypothetical protein [Neorhizobium galegae]MCQ1771315.1 hypothetical protein [Neorhizobium galegae]MCQ1799799.1 hypothetical protein [Neorhizobium galegae]